MFKTCRICKIQFKTEENAPELTLCKDCTKAIEEAVLKDNAIAVSLAKVLVQNPVAMLELGKAMLSIQMKDIGLGGPGSIAEFFREEVDS